MKHHPRSFPRSLAAFALAVGVYCPLGKMAAADAPFPDGEPCGECVALSEQSLDEARGGLQLPNGFLVTFGLKQSLFVNGGLASATTLNTSFTSGGLGDVDLQRSASNIIQIGDNNQLSAAARENLQGGLGTLIQNSADQQVIQTLTMIDIVVSKVDFLSTSPVLQNDLYEAIIDTAVRP